MNLVLQDTVYPKESKINMQKAQDSVIMKKGQKLVNQIEKLRRTMLETENVTP